MLSIVFSYTRVKSASEENSSVSFSSHFKGSVLLLFGSHTLGAINVAYFDKNLVRITTSLHESLHEVSVTTAFPST